ncbi:MAG: protein kinase [Myxococcales bacterium]
MLDVGQQIGGYTVIQLIGKGGMGEVYLGQHRRVARRAAIKVLNPDLSHKATIVDRFFSEARATSLIRHSGIVEIIDCDIHEGQAYIIMELLEGESLGEYMQRTGPLSRDLGLALGVGVNVARAVGAAHALEMVTIVHRDLKPDNIFLHLPGKDGTAIVKVLDFGIAKLAEQGVASQTSTGVLMGTPSYMSPEQCRGARAVDARSDIYSLGCILYETMAGKPPFVSEGVGDLIIAHVSEQATPLTKLVPAVPPQLEAIIARMMAKRPDDRPQSMAEVADKLLEISAGLDLQIGVSLHPQRPVERPAELAKALAVTPIPGGKSTPGTGPQRILSPVRPPTPGTQPMIAPDDGEHRPASTAPHPGMVQPPPGSEANPSGPHRIVAGGTQVMTTADLPATQGGEANTTLPSAAGEVHRRPIAGPRRAWPFVVGVAAVAVVVLVIVTVASPGQTRKVAGTENSSAHPAAAAAASEPVPGQPSGASPVDRKEPAPVTISLSGVPEGRASATNPANAVAPPPPPSASPPAASGPLPTTAGTQPRAAKFRIEVKSAQAVEHKVTIAIASDPPGADVCLARDRIRLGRTTFDWKAEKSSHAAKFLIRKRGYRGQEIEVAPDHDVKKRVKLDKLRPDDIDDVDNCEGK